MSENKKFTKEELVELVKKHGYFKKDAIKEVWGRENGHFYYGKPPKFIDGLAAFKITREDVEGNAIDYPFNGKETAEMISKCEKQEELDALITEGKLLKEDARKGVLTALGKKKEEFSS